MNKKIIKIIALCLGVITLFTSFVGCGTNDDSNLTTGNIEFSKKAKYNGTHVYNISENENEYFIKDGKSDYKIIISPQPKKNDLLAIEEFNSLLRMAVGITLPYEYAQDVSFTENDKYISVGDNDFAVSANITYDKSKLSSDGFKIVSKGKSVFLLGADDGGVVNAVYKFMNVYFNYEFFSRDCIEIDTNVKEKTLKTFDVTDVPDIPLRVTIHNSAFGSIYDTPTQFDVLAYGEEATVAAKNRQKRYQFNVDSGTPVLPVYTEFNNANSYSELIHNAFNYVTPEQAQPGWLSRHGMQLCYSASSHTDHFDEENFNALAQHCADKIANSLKIYPREEYPQYKVATLTQEDTAGFCDCVTCREWCEKDNGAISGGMIRLNNAIRTKLQAWMDIPENEPYKRDDFKIVFFAYNASEPCPVNYDKNTKKWVPANEEVKMIEGTGVWYACQTNMNYEYSIYDAVNDKGREIFEQWTDMTDYIWLWTYGCWYKQSDFFHDGYNFFNSDAYQYFASKGVDYLYDETLGRTVDWTAFFTMKAYVESELMWDSSLNQETLINKYLNAMFKNAAPMMKELFDDMRMHFAQMVVKTGAKGSPAYTKSTDNYKVSDFERWMSHIDNAILAIDKYKQTDENLYELIKHRIDVETVFPLAGMLELYGSSRGTPPFNLMQKKIYVDRLKSIAKKHPNCLYKNASLLEWINAI